MNPQVSIHALDGTSDSRTIRVKGGLKGKIIHVLIDSDSTHNFVDLNVAKIWGVN